MNFVMPRPSLAVNIGNAPTELAARMTKGKPNADGSLMAEPVIDVTLVADMVLQMANLLLEAHVQFVTIKTTKMPSPAMNTMAERCLTPNDVRLGAVSLLEVR
jgi:hypothetical protein